MRAPVEDILLVEHDPREVELAVLALTANHLGGRLRVTGRPAEALAYLSRDPRSPPGLILLDTDLPDEGAVAFLRKLAAAWRTRTIPVVALVRSDAERERVEAWDLGLRGCIVKPLDAGKFVEALSSFSLFWRSTAGRVDRERAGRRR